MRILDLNYLGSERAQFSSNQNNKSLRVIILSNVIIVTFQNSWPIVMPPLAPMQVRLGGAPSHTIPCQGYFCQCSGAALKNQAMHLQCRAGFGAALQHYSAVWCRARQFNLTFCLEDSLHQFIRTLRAVLQSEVSLSSEDTCEDEDRHKERHPGTHLGHSRHTVPFWRWPWNIWRVYCGYLLRADPTKDFSFSPGQHSNYNYYKTYQRKVKTRGYTR